MSLESNVVEATGLSNELSLWEYRDNSFTNMTQLLFADCLIEGRKQVNK